MRGGVTHSPTFPPPFLQAAPDTLYQVMLNCWEKESTRRPTFAQNKADLEDLARNNFVGRYTREGSLGFGIHTSEYKALGTHTSLVHEVTLVPSRSLHLCGLFGQML